MNKFITLFFLMFMLDFPAYSVDATQDSEFYKKQENQLRREYRECTGDSSDVKLQYLIAWANAIHDWASSPQFDSAYKTYSKTTGITGPAVPCELYNWVQSQNRGTLREQQDMARILDKRESAVADSLYVADDKKKNQASQCDFAAIPFGVTRKTFGLLFSKRFPAVLTNDYTRLVARDVGLGGNPYTVACYFNRSDRFYKYELESGAFPADSLDLKVRTIAESLAAEFESRLGAAGRMHRFGMFDIMANKLTPYKEWNNDPLHVSIGVSMFRYKYYVKAIVVNKQLEPVEK